MLGLLDCAYEIELVIKIAARLSMEAELGFRIKPSTEGSGRWADSGGEQAKFGLNTHEMILAVDLL